MVDALRKASLRRQETADRPQPRVPEVRLPQPASQPEPEHVAPEPEPETELDLADYTWTHFWTWARANNLSTKGQVEQRIGRPIDNLTPREVRQMLHETGMPL